MIKDNQNINKLTLSESELNFAPTISKGIHSPYEAEISNLEITTQITDKTIQSNFIKSSILTTSELNQKEVDNIIGNIKNKQKTKRKI